MRAALGDPEPHNERADKPVVAPDVVEDDRPLIPLQLVEKIAGLGSP